MRIQHNIMAMNAYRNYTNNVSAMKKNLEKLSSGYKINRAGDDAAGLAISEKMRAQITGLQQAQANAKSGINLVQTAEGALTEVHDMLNRMVKLADQSANGTYDNTTDRNQMQKEINQLLSEINRIADSSNFNGINLLDGTLGLNKDAFTSFEAVAGEKATDGKIDLSSLLSAEKAGATITHLETESANAAKPAAKIDLNDLKIKVAKVTTADADGVEATLTINGVDVTLKFGASSTADKTYGTAEIGAALQTALQNGKDMKGVKNVEVLEFIDNGYSGTNFERPAVQELLDQMREGKINCIIVKDFTRFGRNSIEVGYFMEMVFPLYGVRFISINDDFDSDNLHGDTGGINVAFKYLVSEFYSRDLSIKYKSAKYVKFRRGEYQSKICPYGYRKGANGRMEPNEETAPNVQMIFELARDGYKPNEIVKALFERNVPTPAEYKAAHGFNGHDISRCCGIWSTSSVVHILDDQRYTGTYIMGKREVTEVGGHHVRMKDESQWVKIPDHHPAIISKELFDQVQAQRPRFKCPKKNARAYPLRGKVYCGCCGHAMPRTAKKNATFYCRYTQVNESAPCHGLTVTEAELEGMLYEVLSKQAQVILNVADLSNAGRLDVQLAEQVEYDKQIENYLDQKRVLYEQFILKQITMEDYKIQKAAVDSELDRLREIHSSLKVQTLQMEMDEKTKSARTELAREVVGAGGLTAGLADTLIDRVYVYPNNQVKIVWKMKDFCMEAA